MKDATDFVWGVIVGAILTSILLALPIFLDLRTRQTQAIEHGAARYHPQTGAFEWIEKLETESKESTCLK